jgi:hypothetical protein
VLVFLEEHGARSVVVTDGIIGCPHEEGVDYETPALAVLSRPGPFHPRDHSLGATTFCAIDSVHHNM